LTKQFVMYYVRDGLYCLSNLSNLVADTINQPNVHNPDADGRRLADCGWFSAKFCLLDSTSTLQK